MPRFATAFPAALKWIGAILTTIGALSLLFVAAYPLGLVRAYPLPPEAAIAGPFGADRQIGDVRSLYREPGESMTVYLERLTKSVAATMVHHWSAGDVWSEADARYTEVSIYDNYLLWMHRLVPEYRASFQNYEFLSPAKALARGYGFCSQVSKLIYSILRDQGIAATISSNPQHTVVEAEGSILDADYGVFIPHTIQWVQQNPVAVDEYYARFGAMVPVLREVYAQPWHTLGTPASFENVRAYEERFDLLKWVAPLLALFAGLSILVGGVLLRPGPSSASLGGLPLTKSIRNGKSAIRS